MNTANTNTRKGAGFLMAAVVAMSLLGSVQANQVKGTIEYAGSSSPNLQLAAFGWWTKCWAIINDTTYINTRATNAKQCATSLRKCTGRSNLTTHFSTNPVLQGTRRVTKCNN